MSKNVKEFFIVLVSVILIGVLSYTITNVYQYANLHGDLSSIPSDAWVSLLKQVFPIFLGLFIFVTILLFAVRRSPDEKNALSSDDDQQDDSIFYSLNIQSEESKPLSHEPEASGVQDTQKTKTPAAEGPRQSRESSEGQRTAHVELSSEELDFFNSPPVEKSQEPLEPQNAVFTPVEEQPNKPIQNMHISGNVTENKIFAPTEAQQPLGSSTSDSIYVKDFYVRFQKEVDFSNDKKYEIALILINIEPKKYPSDFLIFKEAVESYFSDIAFIYDYTTTNTIAVILPFFSFKETQNELMSLYESLKDDLLQRSTLFRAGFTSKFTRLIDSETILYETETAFKKALEADTFCILGFEPDVNKYEQYYSS